MKARSNGIDMVAIGVGGNTRVRELNAIASSPTETNVFTVASFRDLQSIQDSIIQSVCDSKCTAT